MKVAIIDYQLSNLFSVKHALDYLGVESEITTNKNYIQNCDGAIIPGVGAFGNAMANLKQSGLIEVILRHIKIGKPFMGVCLGLQLLFSESEEFGSHSGLDIIKGRVVKFKSEKQIKVPQIGWNKVFKSGNLDLWQKSPLKDTLNGEFMYFVHSYYVVPEEKVILSQTEYEGINYCSSIISDNVFAVQFHPEKSAKEGIKVYRKWIEGIKK